MTTEQEGWGSQLRKGVLELAVLGLLAREPMYGSQLVDELAARPELAITAGTVYPLVARLAKGGLVTRGLASFDENVAGGGGALTTIAYCATGRDGRSFVDQATPADAAIADCRAPAAGVHRHAGAVPFSAVACITGVALPVNGGKAGRMVLPE